MPAVQSYAFRMGEPNSNLKPGTGRRRSLPADSDRATRLVEVFETQGWSWSELAGETGADESTVKRWVNSGAVSADGIGKLARAFSRSRDYIVTGDTSQTFNQGATEVAAVVDQIAALRRDLRGQLAKLEGQLSGLERQIGHPQGSRRPGTQSAEGGASQ